MYVYIYCYYFIFLFNIFYLINFNYNAQENKLNFFHGARGARRDKYILLVQLKNNQELINYLISITYNIKNIIDVPLG